MKSGTTELMKFRRLQRRLGEGVRGTAGLLELLWHATAKNAPQGDIGRFSNEEIAIVCDYDGDPDEMVSALVECGWLDECDDNRLIVHDWHEHCPTYIKGGLARQNKPILRGTTSEVQPDGDSGTTSEVQPIGTTSEVSTTYPNLTKPNQYTTSNEVVCPETQASSGQPKPTEFEFECDGKPDRWVLMQDKLDQWVETFPSLDVVSEIRRARQYVRDNPHKRKTANGMTRYLGSWLQRAQDSGRGRAGPTSQTEAVKPRVATPEELANWRP